ncbi:TetR/AcrR family transcriptional regulator [Stutzerimonas xanthomarina]|jgi:AcrR family transcriptional regulator|uniref:TetR/AcrR family transcriptional regulator n=1 Tax=Stutzerimonas xanthomarina TaxID=271420 RepID=A0A427E141_9GAMM|nr:MULTISPECIES: TetR family transcriptional regulator [Stutzerimonas]MCW8158346.1 TetR/AcrR family transcriptional regulator [Stutzerimonas stutzeri]RRV09803.1 TetR/AcrR family transcriptional regulator [Stutzerimonas xanthomarina]
MNKLEHIRNKAIELIAANGFGSMSLRKLAQQCGMHAGSLYGYYRSKDELLLDLIASYFEDLEQSWLEIAPHFTSSSKRLEGFIAHHIAFQTARSAESTIAAMDLRSLPEPERLQALILRSRYERILHQILNDGAREDLFHPDRTTAASTAILSMLTGLGIRADTPPGIGSEALTRACQQAAVQLAANWMPQRSAA